MPAELTPELMVDWQRFRAAIGDYAKHTIEHFPKPHFGKSGKCSATPTRRRLQRDFPLPMKDNK